MANQRVTLLFVARFLARYVRTRTWCADGLLIMDAADDGVWFARAADWLMRQLSVTWNLGRGWARLSKRHREDDASNDLFEAVVAQEVEEIQEFAVQVGRIATAPPEWLNEEEE